MKSNQFSREWVWATLFLLGACIHVVGIGMPFLGHFAQHQADYATVVQRWLETGLDPLKPAMRFLARGTNRYFYGDLPLNMVLTTWLVQWTGWSISFAGRLLVVIYYFLSVLGFWKLLKLLEINAFVRSWALYYYLLSPLTLIYGQAYLLEIPALCFGVWGYYYFILGTRTKALSAYLIGAFFLSLMLSLRIYYAPILIPLAVLWFRHRGIKAWSHLQTYALPLLAISIPLIWHLTAAALSSAHGDESSLQDNLRVFVLSDPILQKYGKNLTYYLPMAVNFIAKIVTPVGFCTVILAFLGVRKQRSGDLLRFCSLGILAYLSLFLIAVRKFIEFDYYYLPLVPFFALIAALGTERLTSGKSKNLINLTCVLVTFLFALRLSINPILRVPEEDAFVLKSAQLVREYVPKDARVIASHGSSSSFLYYCEREGWTFQTSEDRDIAVRHQNEHLGSAIDRLELRRKQGARYFALADKRQIKLNPGFFNYLDQKYQRLKDTEESLIYHLQSS